MLPSEHVQRGWLQGRDCKEIDGVQHVCAGMAIVEWVSDMGLEYNPGAESTLPGNEKVEWFMLAVDKRIPWESKRPKYCTWLGPWNDDLERTKEDVVGFLQEVERELGLTSAE